MLETNSSALYVRGKHSSNWDTLPTWRYTFPFNKFYTYMVLMKIKYNDIKKVLETPFFIM